MVSDLIVTLERGFPAESLPDLWEWLNSPRYPNFDDFAPDTYEAFCVSFAVRQYSEVMWSIRHQGIIAGYLAFAPFSNMVGQFHGLVIHPEMRCNGIGRAAIGEAVTELLSLGFSKLMVSPFADNELIVRMFQSLGFVQEGRLTNMTRRDGVLTDTLILALNYKGA